MKLSLNWLNQYIDHGLSADELAHRMTMAGLEVEHIERVGEDTVFEIEVTPNRPDALSILGLAREVSAIVDKDLKSPEVSDLEDAGSVDITIEDAESCGRYIGTVIEGVSVQASPLDQQKLLGAMGSNGISNIVDITNFVLFEYGQPLHAFDLDKLEGGKIIVRRAKRGEKITTLDGIERALDESILVIADAKKPVAIAGIMGGMATGVTASTRRVILESAYFDLGIVRRASRRLGLTSDAAYRFERGVAFRTVETASNRAADLILKMAGGQIVARRDVVAREVKAARQEIQVSQNDIENLIGASLDAPRCEKILKRLGCIVAPGKKSLVVIPPHWRGDLKIKEDVIEEVGRVIGYDNLPQSLPRVQAINIPVDLNREDFFNRASEILVGQGLNQIMTYSLISRAALENVRYAGTKPVALQNPMSAEQEIMPPTLMPGFLTVAAFNIHRGARDLGLFEVAKRYLPGGERWTLGILLTGRCESDWRRAKKPSVDLYDLKGVLTATLDALNIRDIAFTLVEDASFDPGQVADVLLNGVSVGRLGRVAEEVVAAWDIKKTPVYFAEVDLETLREAVAPQEKYQTPDEYPAMVRDVSLAVKGVSFAELKALAEKEGAGLLRKIGFVELYTGDKIEAGYKGYVLSLTYQSRERTLTDEEVATLHEGIVAKMIGAFGVKRR